MYIHVLKEVYKYILIYIGVILKKLSISVFACSVILLTGCSTTTSSNLVVNPSTKQQAQLHAKAIKKVITHAKNNSSEIEQLSSSVNKNNQTISMLEEKYQLLIEELKSIKEKLLESNESVKKLSFKENYNYKIIQNKNLPTMEEEQKAATTLNPNTTEELKNEPHEQMTSDINVNDTVKVKGSQESIEVTQSQSTSVSNPENENTNDMPTTLTNDDTVTILTSNVFLRQDANPESQKIDVLRANRIIKIIDDSHPTMAKIDYFNGYVSKSSIANIKKSIIDNKIIVNNHFITLKKLLVKSSFVNGSTTMDVLEKDKEVYVDYVINGKAYINKYKGFVEFTEQSLVAVHKEK